jgi:Flp pilus assembly protein TadD
MNAGRGQEALREFELVKKLDPANKNVYYLTGLTYQKMNQLDRALESYRQCTSGVYASVAQNATKMLEKKLGKVSGR